MERYLRCQCGFGLGQDRKQKGLHAVDISASKRSDPFSGFCLKREVEHDGMTTVDADVCKKIDETAVVSSRKPREPAGKQFVWVRRDSLR